MKGLFFGVFSFFLLTASAEAATLYMDPGDVTINRGDTVSVAIRLDTDEGECVNVVDGVISYTENIVPIDTSRGSSIMSIWLEEPKIDKANRTITFAAGIPNGYCGRIIGDPMLTNRVLEMVFAAPGLQIGTTESGNVADIVFAEGTRVLLNDGFGTDAPLKLFDAKIEMSKTAGNVVANDWNDRVNEDDIPPQDFSISLERTPNAFSNRYFIVFNTTDKQSGIDYYEVMEEPLEEQRLFNWGRVDAPWVKAQSPYVLEDQSLNSTIRVKAYDKAGNEYIAVLVPDEAQRTMSTESKVMVFLIAGTVGLFLLATLAFIWWQRRRVLVEVNINIEANGDYDLDEEEEEIIEDEHEHK